MTKKKYVVNKKNNKLDDVKTITIEGYSLSSKKHKFYIKGESVSNIIVTDEELIKKLVIYKIDKKYKNLIKAATDILSSEDDSDEGCTIILDSVERFRQEIKNKYKEYLSKEQLTKMAKQLTIIKKAAEQKKFEIRQVLLNDKKENKSK